MKNKIKTKIVVGCLLLSSVLAVDAFSQVDQQVMDASAEQAQGNYRKLLTAGAGKEYKSLSSIASAATKENVLEEQLLETEKVRNELQFILKAYIQRLSYEEAIDFLTEKMNGIESIRKKIKTDMYQSYADSSLNAYSEFLTETVKRILKVSNDNN